MRGLFSRNVTALLLTVLGTASAQSAAAQNAYSWTGFYIGANLGAGFGDAKNNVSFVDSVFPFSSTRATTSKLDGFIGGGQMGYNWQVTPTAVVGLEADWQSFAAHGTQSYSDSISTFVPGGGFVTDTIGTSYRAKTSWLGTIRGRIGFARNDLLFYGTGGIAFGRIGISGTASEAADLSAAGAGPFASTTPFNVMQTRMGWTLGAGVEGALVGDWSWKLEYLYVDLGSIAGTFTPQTFAAGETLTVQSRFNANLVRAGLNFRFK
jgi:outer membrane immunogenic protein